MIINVYSQNASSVTEIDEPAEIVQNGSIIGTIRITSIKDITQLYDNAPFPQIIMFEYMYENTNIDLLRIGILNFRVIDEERNVATSGGYGYPMTKFPKEIPIGYKCTAQAIFGLEKNSSKIVIELFLTYFNWTYPANASFSLLIKE